jgi:pentatricopeptide repeat protein
MGSLLLPPPPPPPPLFIVLFFLLFPSQFISHISLLPQQMAEKACQVMASKGLSKTPLIYNLMIRGYGKKGHLEDAIHEMESMQDEVTTLESRPRISPLHAGLRI